MRWRLLAILGFLSISSSLGAEVPEADKARFDILSLKLGMTLEEAAKILLAASPDMKVETRRVDISTWDKVCIGEFSWDPSKIIPCGTWNDGLDTPVTIDATKYPYASSKKARIAAFQKAQSELNSENSIIVGFVALADTRAFKIEAVPCEEYHRRLGLPCEKRTLLSGDMDALRIVVSPTPGNQRVIAIARVKSYLAQTRGRDDTFSQLTEKYGLLSSWAEPGRFLMDVLVDGKILGEKNLNARVGSAQNCRGWQSNNFGNDDPTNLINPNLPDRITSACAVSLYAEVYPDPANARFAAGFSVLLLDNASMVELGRERALIAKTVLDKQFRQNKPAFKEKL